MLTLDQVQKLEQKVEKAVSLIKELQREKTDLENKLSQSLGKISELEGVINSFRQDQNRIEEGILSALSRLSEFEDAAVAGRNPSEPDAGRVPEFPHTIDNNQENPEPVLETGVDLDFEDTGDDNSGSFTDNSSENQLEIF